MKRTTLLILSLVSFCAANAQNKYKQYTDNLPFQMAEVQAPVIPDRRVELTNFDAVGTGEMLCTEAFAKGISYLKRNGGGHLIVPRGVWLTGPIEGLDTRRCQSPLSANGATNISITGQGVIDGNGQYWRPVKRAKVTDAQWKEILKRPGGREMRKDYWVPSEGYEKGEKGANMNVPASQTEEEWQQVKRFLRPVLVILMGCKNVLLEGVIFQNSPAWNIHPLMCENIIIDNVLARNPAFAQNGDALDLESCTNALIVNSKFDAGDDGICLKSGKDADGRRRGVPCSNVVVDGCTVFAGHGGFVVGSEMSGGVRNISVRSSAPTLACASSRPVAVAVWSRTSSSTESR